MPEELLEMLKALGTLDENDPDLKNILDMDTDDLDDEIEYERILKEIVLNMRIVIPTAKRLGRAYFELYQLIAEEEEAGLE